MPASPAPGCPARPPAGRGLLCGRSRGRPGRARRSALPSGRRTPCWSPGLTPDHRAGIQSAGHGATAPYTLPHRPYNGRGTCRCGRPASLASFGRRPCGRGGGPRTAPPVTGRVRSPPYPAAAAASTTARPSTSRGVRQQPGECRRPEERNAACGKPVQHAGDKRARKRVISAAYPASAPESVSARWHQLGLITGEQADDRGVFLYHPGQTRPTRIQVKQAGQQLGDPHRSGRRNPHRVSGRPRTPKNVTTACQDHTSQPAQPTTPAAK